MKAEHHVMTPEELMPRITGLLELGETVPLIISGGSMNPFLVHGRDTVFLSPPNRTFKRGDMIFYRRDNGQYVLHRIFRLEGECYCLVGDAQTELEHGIRQNQIIAYVSAVNRKGKVLKPGSFLWFFFEKIWIRMVPIRHLVMGAYTKLFG